MATASENATITLPNPFTPMAFLPPEIAFQEMTSTYIVIGALGVLIWDILNNIASDYRLLLVHRIRIPTVAYFVSRIGTLGFSLVSALFITAPIGVKPNDCANWEQAVNAFYPVGVSATCLLFFFRIRAVFNRQQHIVILFFILWLGVLGSSLAVVTALTGGNIGPTKYCLVISFKSYVSAAAIIALVHDTFVFAAISWKLAMNGWVQNDTRVRLKTLLFGDSLPLISRALMQDGQLYYLTTVGSGVIVVMMIYIPGIPLTYRTMFTIPNMVLTNIMACRVFRNTRDRLQPESESMELGRLKPSKNGLPIPLSFGGTTNSRGEVDPTAVQSGHNQRGRSIMITKTVNQSHDYPLSNEDKSGYPRAD